MRINHLFFLLFGFIHHNILYSQWKFAENAPTSYAVIPTQALKNDTLVLRNFSAQKLYYSVNAGQDWTDISNPSYADYELGFIKDNKVFAISFLKGVAVFENGQWKNRNNGLVQSQGSYQAQLSSFNTDGKRVIIRNVKNGVPWFYLSDNDGLNWTPAGSTGLQTGYRALYGAFANGAIYTQGSANNKPEIHISKDGGMSWKLLYAPGTSNAFAPILTFNTQRTMVLIQGPNAFFLHQNDSLIQTSGLPVAAGNLPLQLLSNGNNAILRMREAAGDKYYLSADGGLKWYSAGSLLNNALPGFIGNLLIAYKAGEYLLQSTDFGLNWTPLPSEGLPSDFLPKIRSVYGNSDNLYCSLTVDEGFYRFDPSAKRWEVRSKGLPKSSGNVQEMFGTASEWLINSNESTFFSKDNGQNWHNIGLSFASFQKMNNHFFAINWPRLWKSANGQDWEVVSAAPRMYNLWKWKNKLIGLSDSTLEISTDEGFSWQSLALSPEIDFISAMAFDSTRWHAAAFSGGFVSTDEGVHFSKLSEFYGGNALLINKGRLLSGGSEGIFYTDNGSTWKPGNVPFSVFVLRQQSISAINGALVAVSSDGSVIVSVDNGSTWKDFSTGLSSSNGCTQVMRVGDFLYAACYNGLYKRPAADLPAVVAVSEPHVGLYKPSPNPTTGLFRLNADFDVPSLEVQVSDLSGKIVIHRMLQIGNPTVDLNGLPSGMYVLKIYDGQRWSVSRVAKQ